MRDEPVNNILRRDALLLSFNDRGKAFYGNGATECDGMGGRSEVILMILLLSAIYPICELELG